MKKVLAISIALSLGVGFTAGLCWKELTAHAAGGGGTPKGNGDVNGDGFINITDVLGILNWMFLGGADLVPIVCPPPGGGALPATGQTKCYDNAGGEIDCASVDFPGQDGFYKAGCATAGRFVDNKDGTVTDNCTGLMWQKVTADVSGNVSIGEEDRLDWQDALKYCANLDFAKHTDWQLPNVRELQSIANYGRSFPSVDSVFFKAMTDSYWSSTSYDFLPGIAWYVYFFDGNVYLNGKENKYFVRAMRRGP